MFAMGGSKVDPDAEDVGGGCGAAAGGSGSDPVAEDAEVGFHGSLQKSRQGSAPLLM